MAENINATTPFSSGGHLWVWGPREQAVKGLRTVGESGEGRMVLGNYSRRCVIESLDGAPAVLKATGDAALNAIEDNIEAMIADGSIMSWEDDAGRTGDALVVEAYVPVGNRQYSVAGGEVWQLYKCYLRELLGRP